MSEHPMDEEQLTSSEQKKTDPPIQPKSGKSVAIYLVILFVAAFALLLMAYFQQQRTNNQVINNLQSSVNQFQTLDELRQENKALREELELHHDLVDALIEAGFASRSEDGTIILTLPSREAQTYP